MDTNYVITFILRKLRVAIFADIITPTNTIVTMFIKTIFKDSKKF